jgi:hypothetical protein
MVKSHNKRMARDLFRQFELYVLGRQKDAAVRDLVLEPRIKLTKVQTIYESDYPQPRSRRAKLGRACSDCDRHLQKTRH